MRTFQQNLLIIVALSLCGLCVYQWYGQTLQRNQIQKLEQTVYDKSAAIQGYTNSMRTMDRQIAQIDARLTKLQAEAKTNADLAITQRRELNRLQITAEGLTNQITEYNRAVTNLQGRLKEAYDGIKKQNEAMKELVAQREEFVKKFNDEVKDRNDVVNKYNELVRQVEKNPKALPPDRDMTGIPENVLSGCMRMPFAAIDQAENLRKTRRDHANEIAEDYAEAIADLVAEAGEARVVDLAKRLGVTHVTVNRTIRRLREAGLVTSQPYRAIFLTGVGRALAAACKSRHRTVVAFLRSLGVSERVAEMDAEGVEHHVSAQTLAVFKRFAGFGRDRVGPRLRSGEVSRHRFSSSAKSF